MKLRSALQNTQGNIHGAHIIFRYTQQTVGATDIEYVLVRRTEEESSRVYEPQRKNTIPIAQQ